MPNRNEVSRIGPAPTGSHRRNVGIFRRNRRSAASSQPCKSTRKRNSSTIGATTAADTTHAAIVQNPPVDNSRAIIWAALAFSTSYMPGGRVSSRPRIAWIAICATMAPTRKTASTISRSIPCHGTPRRGW